MIDIATRVWVMLNTFAILWQVEFNIFALVYISLYIHGMIHKCVYVCKCVSVCVCDCLSKKFNSKSSNMASIDLLIESTRI